MFFRTLQLFEVIFAPLKNHGLLVIISKLVFIDDTFEKNTFFKIRTLR